MSTDERVRAEERALDVLFSRAAEDAPLGGVPGERAIRVPAGAELLLASRRLQRTRRTVSGSLAVAAGLLVAAAVGGTATGAWQLPLPTLRGERADLAPAILEASRGSKVGDLINELDGGWGGVESDESSRTFRYVAEAGASAPGFVITDEDGDERDAAELQKRWEERVDRTVETRSLHGAGSGDLAIRLIRTRPGTTEAVSSRTLPTLTLGDDGRGRWLRVRPSAQDGWLVLAVLPPGADMPQLRVAGTGVTLPIESMARDLADCNYVTDDGPDMPDTLGWQCDDEVKAPSVVLRIATPSEEPPVDAITYLKDGHVVVLDERSAQTITD